MAGVERGVSRMSEIIESTDGRYRARIEHDLYGGDFKPDGCWFGTVYTMELGWHEPRVEIIGQDGCVKTDLTGEISELWSNFRDMEQMERVLRGEFNVCDSCYAKLSRHDGEVYAWTSEAGPVCPEWEGEDSDWHNARYDFTDNPIVGFDYIERNYGKMIVVITLKDLQHWGYESVADYQQSALKDADRTNPDPSYGILKEWEAWADGDVYYVVIEQRVGTRTIVTDLETGDVIEDDTDEDWHEFDRLHGLIGWEYAEERANELLSDAVATCKEETA
jgi:hypothetical protein